MALTYAEQIKHPLWQRRRLEMFNARGFKCESCGSEEKTLHVHHLRYVKGRMIWDYTDPDLAVLCEDCHTHYHDWKELLDQVIAAAAPNQIGSLTATLVGLAETHFDILGEKFTFSGDVDGLKQKVGSASQGYMAAGNAMGLIGRVYWAACAKGQGDEFWKDIGDMLAKYVKEPSQE